MRRTEKFPWFSWLKASKTSLTCLPGPSVCIWQTQKGTATFDNAKFLNWSILKFLFDTTSRKNQFVLFLLSAIFCLCNINKPKTHSLTLFLLMPKGQEGGEEKGDKNTLKDIWVEKERFPKQHEKRQKQQQQSGDDNRWEIFRYFAEPNVNKQSVTM